MKILGIDPGLAVTGFGIVGYDQNRFSVIQYGVVRTQAGTSLPERLEKINQGLTRIIQQYQPEAVAVEELFFNTNAKSAFLVGQARGVAVLTAAQASLPVYEYTPLQVKQGIAGYGRADKHQVQQMIKNLLNLREIPRPVDAADALAVAVCHAHTGSFQRHFTT